MNEALRLIVNIFPDNKERILQLYAENDDFRSLIQDYMDALKAERYWRQSHEFLAPERVLEYETLIGELREDIRRFLEKREL